MRCMVFRMAEPQNFPVKKPGSITPWVEQVDCLIDNLQESLGDLPYDPTPERLYCAADLYEGFDNTGFESTVDQAIYDRAQKAGHPLPGPIEELAQRLHDHGMSLAVNEFCTGKTLVGVMGGHSLRRGSSGYIQAVELGRRVAQTGSCIVTGGGPGAMEAANFGALTSKMDTSDVDLLVEYLAKSPSFYEDVNAFISTGLEVLSEVAEPCENLSIPTWFYGHEPSNPFATHIVKYFSNSIREDGLLAIAKGGIVFLAGGPGTMQEVFQDAAQNAYKTFGEPSPMVFLDPPDRKQYWETTGALGVLDKVFTTADGTKRPGWDLVSSVSNITDALDRLST